MEPEREEVQANLGNEEAQINPVSDETAGSEPAPIDGASEEKQPSTSQPHISFCPQCGSELKPGAAFCGSCGKRVSETAPTNDTKKSKGALPKLLIPAVGILLVIIAAFAVVPQLMVSADELMAEGDFAAAYAKADEDSKQDILIANQIAVLCPDIVDGLKDSASFGLTNAWFDSEENQLVLNVSGNNSYGAKVSNYYYYTYDSDEEAYSLYVTLSDLSDEELRYYDDSSDRLEKILKNAARESVRTIIDDDDLKLPKQYVKCINQLFEDDLLDEVEALPELAQLAPSDEETDI